MARADQCGSHNLNESRRSTSPAIRESPTKIIKGFFRTAEKEKGLTGRRRSDICRNMTATIDRPVGGATIVSKTVDVTFDTLFHIPHFSFLIPHPSPIGQRLPDCYPPLNGRGLSSRPISRGGLLQCDKKKNSTQVSKKSGTSQISTDRMLASVGIPAV